MPAFTRKPYPSQANTNTFAARYRRAMSKHPFALFGLPFLFVIIGGSFVLTPATAIRYERHDRKVRQMTREEELSVGKGSRRVDMREEYYVGCLFMKQANTTILTCLLIQRLAAKDIDNWEQKRVKRLKGESDGIL